MPLLPFFLPQRFWTVLVRLPDRYLDPGYVPPAVPTAAVSAVAAAIFSWLIYERAENRLYRARDAYLGAMSEKYRSAISLRALRLLQSWLGGGDALAERGLVSFPAIIAAERAGV